MISAASGREYPRWLGPLLNESPGQWQNFIYV